MTCEVVGLQRIFDDEPYNVELKLPDGMYTEVGIEEISPIALTEDWLKRFGFEIDRWSNGTKIMGTKKDFNSLADYGSQKIVIELNEHTNKWDSYLECGYYQNQIDCSYVHQLQNLFWCLTGQELTVAP